MQYQVIRDFSGHQTGAILADTDFIHARRARQLVEMRFISAVPDADDVHGLTGGTVAEMKRMVAEVTDIDVLQVALEQEQRASAKRLLSKRLEELQQ